MILYFNSILMPLGIIILSAILWWVNDQINPSKHPVVNIVQAIIFAIIVIFVR